MVDGCQSLGQGLFLEDARDYEIRTRDEDLKERDTKSCLCWQERGRFIKGRVRRGYVRNCGFDCGQVFMEEGVFKIKMAKGFQEDFGFVVMMILTGIMCRSSMIVGLSSGFCEDFI